jgi:hypothetical protein
MQHVLLVFLLLLACALWNDNQCRSCPRPWRLCANTRVGSHSPSCVHRSALLSTTADGGEDGSVPRRHVCRANSGRQSDAFLRRCRWRARVSACPLARSPCACRYRCRQVHVAVCMRSVVFTTGARYLVVLAVVWRRLDFVC